MDINLELYKVFYYVATSLSFSEASRQLFISQSAVSQSIKTLEKKLNHTLFIRSTKKVLLTPEGELLLQHVKPALQMLVEGEALLSGDNMLKGQLRIGASDTICRYYLISYLQQFHQVFPDVRIKVTNSTSIGCVELLEKGQVDLIVCNFPNSRLGNHMQIRVLKEFQDIFIGNPEYFPLNDMPRELNTLLEYPIRQEYDQRIPSSGVCLSGVKPAAGSRTQQQRPSDGSRPHRARHCLYSGLYALAR